MLLLIYFPLLQCLIRPVHCYQLHWHYIGLSYMAVPPSTSITLAIDGGRTPCSPLSVGWLSTGKRCWPMEGKLLTLGCYCFSSSMALLTPDQGHFIMGCPAATLLSTGLSDEVERSQLWQRESRLQNLDKDQPLSGVKTAKKEGWKKKKRWFCILPPKHSECWQIDLLCSLHRRAILFRILLGTATAVAQE